ncbi:uncharacterized protein K02A2.6-like [Octopus bimaculoides]|uniref:uncharacterized protein K02A2.6-like n=1 Tax=Octopus bimaculoides TaxID=37653 RepID=UPI00071CFA9E|nr:uncharacterized protein K02A2.6-like [Octopus bimaculoides]|eukprot:XP_014775940.1 PREDICTED: uncharacterized protein K02A2.6-like [Octopus bimaculoides]
MYGQRILISETLQERILKEFHIGHPGIARTKALMCSYVHWLKMGKEVENVVKGCRGRALTAKLPTQKWKPWPGLKCPWTRLHIDFAGPLNGYYYLVDNLTKWPEIVKCKRPTSETVIYFLHKLFARFGIPNVIVSDSGTRFVSSEFRKFCEMFTVEHKTIVPYHLRSNGQAERFMDTFKRALRKANKEVTDEVALQQFLRVYRVTPNSNTPAESSSAELMFVRKDIQKEKESEGERKVLSLSEFTKKWVKVAKMARVGGTTLSVDPLCSEL